jgi:F-type H+-transporting ATPase subunit delta
MAVENTTIARPYAEAVFACAQGSNSLDKWSDMLGFLAEVVPEPRIAALISNPKIDRATLSRLVLDIGGERLDAAGQNLVRVLVENRRLNFIPEVAQLYEDLKNESMGSLEVQIQAPYPIDSAQQEQLAKALEKRLQREIKISSVQDPTLIGGLRIRAGDITIDGSVQGQLHQLATELGI